MNRYWKTLWEAREDLQQVFPDPEGASAEAYAQWMHEHAREQFPSLPQPTPGVNLVGYLSSERGLGEAARQILAAIEASGVPTAAIDIPADAEALPAALRALPAAGHPHDFNLFCVNADMQPALVAAAGARLFADRRSAGLWFWEVSTFPQSWFRSFDSLDEIWVATEYVAAVLAPVAPVPVRSVRLPIVPSPPAAIGRAELGMPEGFCFLFVFDYRSVFRRKNPLRLVRAFGEAFAPGKGPSLVIKSVSGDEFPVEREELRAAAAERPEIHLLEDTVSPAAKNAMIASCDCFVSLHRSEGLGLTMGEAMYFGRPVIATGYSGNLDFMTAENSFLVRHEMVPIGAGAAPYPAEGEWAEPDLAHAAALMRQVFEEPQRAAERGERAAADIRRTHSVAAAVRALPRLLSPAAGAAGPAPRGR